MPWKKKPLEIYQTERGVDYYLFVDESGTHVIKKILNCCLNLLGFYIFQR
ncbi:hypothetical protein BSPWISOXPB_6522 [uncultured Gammaproteobacteria bacterium]|nr:hypothetical protein BSPWISOXPB_6522 [uncultured Gammaproteobacteria bacterium]